MNDEVRNARYPVLSVGVGVAIAFAALLAGLFFGSIFVGRANNQNQPDLVATMVHMTAMAQLTQNSPSPTATSVPPTYTPTNTPEPTATATATSTATPAPTATSTATPVPRDWAQFVSDVTIRDGSILVPGEQFTKIWRLKNRGTRTWTSDYDLVFVSGTRMGGSAAVALPENVSPGETIDLAVQLTAPEEPGHYRGRWMLRNAAGGLFGLGPNADQPFWVDIEVEDPDDLVYDLAVHFCDADWASGAGSLPCPGDSGDDDGFVILLDSPIMEGEHPTAAPALLVEPEHTSKGWITGAFPGFTVTKGDHFRAAIACLEDSPRCYVRFRLQYQIGDGELKNLGTWLEASEGLANRIDIDLSGLQGRKVKLFLTVSAVDSWRDDSALWIRPRIVH